MFTILFCIHFKAVQNLNLLFAVINLYVFINPSVLTIKVSAEQVTLSYTERP